MNLPPRALAWLLAASITLALVAPSLSLAQANPINATPIERLVGKMRLNMQVCVELLRSAVMLGEWPECGVGDGRAIQYEFEDALASAKGNDALTALLIESQNLFLALAGRVSPFEGEELPAYRDRIVGAVESVEVQLGRLSESQK